MSKDIILESIESNTHLLRIMFDTNPIDPRTNKNNITTIVTFDDNSPIGDIDIKHYKIPDDYILLKKFVTRGRFLREIELLDTENEIEKLFP